jgi:hypothetical protein
MTKVHDPNQKLSPRSVDPFDFSPFDACFTKVQTFKKESEHLLSQEVIDTFEGGIYFLVSNVKEVKFTQKAMEVKDEFYGDLSEFFFEMNDRCKPRHLSKGAMIFGGWSSREKGKIHFFIPQEVQWLFLSGAKTPSHIDLRHKNEIMNMTYRRWNNWFL